jgi:two-component system, NtrC family, response regulator
MGHDKYPQLIGTSVAISALREEVDRVARSDAKVLISGESGAGKEVVARAIAMHPEGRASAFVPVNCAGTSEALLEAELFGQAPTAAQAGDPEIRGKLEIADQGTIFLDEIGELSLRLQGRLLRFLETGEVQRVGAKRMTSPSDVRVVSATNRDPWDLVARGEMREDFFYRINVIHLVVPPLRERREDIPLLVDHFLKRFTTGSAAGNGNGKARDGAHANGDGTQNPIRAFAPEAMAALCEYSWPGNVRQVENVVERLVVTGRSELVQLDALPGEIRQQVFRRGQTVRERDVTVADNLFRQLVDNRESFWTAVYPLYMRREITRNQVRDLVRKGLEETRGNYRIVLRLFNMETSEYKRFLSFLRKHDCQLPFKEYR